MLFYVFYIYLEDPLFGIIRRSVFGESETCFKEITLNQTVLMKKEYRTCSKVVFILSNYKLLSLQAVNWNSFKQVLMLILKLKFS